MSIKLATAALFLSAAAMAAAQAGPAARGARVSVPDWDRVTRLKPGADVIVDTGLYPIGPQAGERCRVVAVDGSTLTCRTRGWHSKRLVFPAAAVSSVYHVRHVLSPSDVFTITGLTVFIGGAIASSGGALLVGAVILIFVGAAEMAGTAQDAVRAGFGQPRPIPSNERDDLVYLRAPQPVHASASPFGASMP